MLLIGIALCAGLSGAFPLGDAYGRSAVLDPEGRIRLWWKDDGSSITFEVHARTTGWVGLGFSPNGGMGGADIVIGGVRNGQGYLYDRHASSNSWPEQDAQQSYRLLAAAENATHTMLRFTRPLDTCDEQDWPISATLSPLTQFEPWFLTLQKETVRLIWALHSSDAESENRFAKHEFRDRGSKSVLLLDEPAGSIPLPSDARVIDLRPENVALPSDTDSLYWCTIHKLPMHLGKHQMIRYGAQIQAGNEAFVHHAVVYHCMIDMEEYVGKGAPCFKFDDPTYYNPMKACSSRYLAGWAVGGGDVAFPSDMGFPVMEPGSSPYVMLEMHYDNPQLVPGIVDNSGIRLWLTPTTRPLEVGNVMLGLGVSETDFFIPPGLKRFTYYSQCTAKCTDKFPAEGIKFMNVFPHAHLTGVGLRLRHIRNGVELPPIFTDNHYDFNYQEQRLLQPNPTVLPGDILMTECDFDTTDRESTTFAGFSSREEMCLIFANFYPKNADSLFTCLGGPIPSVFGDLMDAKVDQDKGNLVSGPLGSELKFKDYVNRFYAPSDPNFSAKVERLNGSLSNGTYFQLCGGGANSDLAEEARIEQRLRLRRAAERPKPTRIEKAVYDFGTVAGLQTPRRPFVAPSTCAGAERPSLQLSTGNRRSEAPSAIDPNFHSMDEAYDHDAWLDSGRRFHVNWLLGEDSTVTFEIQARTLGWFGFGLSPNGGMKGADMVVGYVDDSGQPVLTDRHGDSNGFPPLDEQQDVTLLGGLKNDTHTIIKFRRLRQTCDEDDVPIGDDTIRMIWALNEHLPTSPESLTMHGNRDRVHWRGDAVPIPSDFHTLYWCQIFELPEQAPHHLIKFEPVIQPGNEPYVHHMILYSCEAKLDMAQYKGKPEACFNRDPNNKEFSPMYACTTKYLAGWAVGGETHTFPDGVGYPFFTSGSDRFLMLETHYDNSAYDRNLRDSSGMRLHLTPHLRPIEAGTLSFGVNVSPMSMIIPPGQANFTQYSFCPSECFDELPAEGISVFAGILHSHLAGRAMRIRHLRGGVELPPLLEDNHYDFNYQEMRNKRRPTKILPGDSFITECTYDTTKRNASSFGGFSTSEEMCLAFVEYYPRMPSLTSFCFSQPEPKTMFGWLGADPEAVDWENKTVEGIPVTQWIADNVEPTGWDRNAAGPRRWEAARELQTSVRERLHVAYCMTPEAADAQRDVEAKAEGMGETERPGVRRREAAAAMKFHMTTVEPNTFVRRRYVAPDVCANRRLSPTGQMEAQNDGRSASNRQAANLGFLGTAIVNIMKQLG